mgnify:CR=1 FL=1
MTPLHIALILSFLSALIFALSQFLYATGTLTTVGAALVGTYHYFTKDSLEDATA